MNRCIKVVEALYKVIIKTPASSRYNSDVTLDVEMNSIEKPDVIALNSLSSAS